MVAESKYPPRRYLTAAERKREILDVAVPLFLEHGYEGTEMGEVARQAGISRALLNRHFGTKRGLLLGIVGTLAEVEPGEIIADPSMSVEQRIAANTEAWLDHFSANRAVLAVAPLATSSDPEVRAAISEVRDRIVDRTLASYLGTADAPDAVKMMMRSFIALALSACHEWLTLGRATREQVSVLMTTTLSAMVERTAPALLRIS